MPIQKPGRSEQVVLTPTNFVTAMLNKFPHLLEGGFVRDLAADEFNTLSKDYFSESSDALIHPWNDIHGVQWCNPPFGQLPDWTAKAAAEARKGAEVFMLVPASVGSNWWRDNVDNKANIRFLNGRLTFKGHTAPYPKDLALLFYARYFLEGSYYSVWDWRKNL
jgi:site-specific DNA-methyltransferase (adenine-specific)